MSEKLKFDEFTPPAPGEGWQQDIREVFTNLLAFKSLKRICEGMQTAYYEIRDTVRGGCGDLVLFFSILTV